MKKFERTLKAPDEPPIGHPEEKTGQIIGTSNALTCLIGTGIGLNSPQRFFVDEKRRLYGAVASNGMPRVVVGTTMVWKVDHVIAPDRIGSYEQPF